MHWSPKTVKQQELNNNNFINETRRRKKFLNPVKYVKYLLTTQSVC